MAKHHGTRAASHVSGKRKSRDSTEEDDVEGHHLISNALKTSKKPKAPPSLRPSNSSYQTCIRSSPRIMAEIEKAKKSGKQREAETAVLANKPIDVLASMATAPRSHSDVTDPLTVFKGLTVKELQDLRADIQTRLDVERMGASGKYWEALLVVCDWEMKEGGKIGDQEGRSFHSRIQQDVVKTLRGRSVAELESYQAHVESEMQLGRAEVVEYWKPVLKHLRMYKARACLREFHTRMLDENCVRAQAASTQQAAR